MNQHLPILFLGSLAGWFLLLFLRGTEELAIAPVAWDSAWWLAWGAAAGWGVFGLFRWLDHRFPWRAKPILRANSGLFLSLVVFLVWIAIGLSVDLAYRGLTPLGQGVYNHLLLKVAILMALLVGLINLCYFVLQSYYLYGRRRLVAAQRSSQQLDLQWRALRTQLKPHFLFNSFNTISALIDEDTARAETYVRRLAYVYDYLLSHHEQPLVRLEEELKLVYAYSYLLETRFANQVRVIIEVDSVIQDRQVPPLAVQLLVENAVKHNQISAQQPLHIYIQADTERLCVRNSLQPKAIEPTSFSIGLNNLQSRYDLLGKYKVEVEQSEDFLVSIPLI